MEAEGNCGANNVVALPPRRAGRPRGSKNRRTVEVEQAMRRRLPKGRAALLRLLTDPKVEDEVRFRAVQMIYHYTFGRPVERKEIGGPGGVPLTSPPQAFTKEDAEQTAKAVAIMLAEAAGKSK